jgi:hypothetical protein
MVLRRKLEPKLWLRLSDPLIGSSASSTLSFPDRFYAQLKADIRDSRSYFHTAKLMHAHIMLSRIKTFPPRYRRAARVVHWDRGQRLSGRSDSPNILSVDEDSPL